MRTAAFLVLSVAPSALAAVVFLGLYSLGRRARVPRMRCCLGFAAIAACNSLTNVARLLGAIGPSGARALLLATLIAATTLLPVILVSDVGRVRCHGRGESGEG